MLFEIAKYVTLHQGERSYKCDHLWQGRGEAKNNEIPTTSFMDDALTGELSRTNHSHLHISQTVLK